MMQFPLIILGAAGNLGRHLCEEALAQGISPLLLTRTACDLSDRAAVKAGLSSLRDRLSEVGPGARIVNAAAYTDVDGAEAEADLAFLVNGLAVGALATAARDHGAWLCHVSTDFVFDGRAARPYDEFDVPAPLSVYGRSKRAGELLLAQSGAESALCRVAGLYGRHGRNFVSTLLPRLQAGEALRLDAERLVQPTFARAAARVILDLASARERGTFHLTCGGATTWHGFAQALAEGAAARGVSLPGTFAAVPTAALATPAPRPAQSLLERRVLRLWGLPDMPDWQEALAAYLDEALVPAAQTEKEKRT